jgi:hypothetical protein
MGHIILSISTKLFREAGSATIVRVAGVGGYKQANSFGDLPKAANSGASENSIGVLYNTNLGVSKCRIRYWNCSQVSQIFWVDLTLTPCGCKLPICS